MRITQNRPVNRSQKSSKSSRSSETGRIFSLDTNPTHTPPMPSSAVTAPLPVGDISTLLSVQAGDPQRERAMAVERGHDTLDALDALKVDVLSGQVTRLKLVDLARLVEKQRQILGDEALTNVLDHIELRARVELAKFEKNRQ